MPDSTLTHRQAAGKKEGAGGSSSSSSSSSPPASSTAGSGSAASQVNRQPVKDGANQNVDRHMVIKVMRMLLVIATVPLALYLHQQVGEQRKAMEQWPRSSRCVVHGAELLDVAHQKKLVFQKTENFRVKVFYSYLTPNGLNRTSTSVYFHERDQPGRTRAYSEQVRDFFRKRGCVAYVNPDDHTQSILIREANFKPYLHCLVSGGLALMFLWYVFLEHDWRGEANSPEEFNVYTEGGQPVQGDAILGGCTQAQSDPDYEQEQKERDMMLKCGMTPPTDDKEPMPLFDLKTVKQWHVLQRCCGIRGWTEAAVGLMCTIVWHTLGYFVWADYATLYIVQGSADEMRYLYHIAGAIMVFRLIYQVSLVLRVHDVDLFIAEKRIAVGEPFVLLFRQRRRSPWVPVTYSRVEFEFTLTETTHGPRQEKGPKRSMKRLHTENPKILFNYTVAPDSKGVAEVVPFRTHSCKIRSDKGAVRCYYRWQLSMRVFIAWSPFSYNYAIPLNVHVDDMFREKEE